MLELNTTLAFYSSQTNASVVMIKTMLTIHTMITMKLMPGRMDGIVK
ncbi:MAG: hypothetical protein MJZ15_00630 [Bacteroidales bacterium]|nr:hypothetical protein [Bacteroidales bacterium]